MNLLAVFVDAVKTAARDRVATGDVIAVIGELFSRRDAGSFANNFIAFDHKLAAIGVGDHPFASEQRDRAVRTVFDRDEIDERMWLVGRE